MKPFDVMFYEQNDKPVPQQYIYRSMKSHAEFLEELKKWLHEELHWYKRQSFQKFNYQAVDTLNDIIRKIKVFEKKLKSNDR